VKRALVCILILMLCTSGCMAEADTKPIYEFAGEFDAGETVKAIFEDALSGGVSAWDAFLNWAKTALVEPLRLVLSTAYSSIAPVFLLAMLRGCLPEAKGSGEGALFLLRLVLMLSFSELAMMALGACETCLRAVARFTSAAAPGIAAVLTAMGMNGTAALVSPAAALAGGIAEDAFLNCGLPLCRGALCLAITGNLSDAVDLNRIVTLLKKTCSWGVGLITVIFTALTTLQGGVSEAIDGVGIRTAKFAVDSAAPVIGSGASDAWESFVSGMMITKNALGVSGIAALLAAGLKPVACCTAAILLLNVIAALLELFGEKQTARAAAQVGGICQMALSLVTGALVIGTVLMGAAMSVGRGIPG